MMVQRYLLLKVVEKRRRRRTRHLRLDQVP
jgi:hypothetical protein